MVDTKQIQNEKHLRILIKKALAKEVFPYTKPSVDFIAHIVDEAYQSDIPYNIDDMRNIILAFAANSTNQADACLKIVSKMHFKSKEEVDRAAPSGKKSPSSSLTAKCSRISCSSTGSLPSRIRSIG